VNDEDHLASGAVDVGHDLLDARFVYHGVSPVKGGLRLNLTFRKVF
jgi:hypothetical protein